jgi:hypothetical protein
VKIRFIKRPRFGPFQLNFRGDIIPHFSSWSFRFLGITWNSKTRKRRVDLPGPWNLEE